MWFGDTKATIILRLGSLALICSQWDNCALHDGGRRDYNHDGDGHGHGHDDDNGDDDDDGDDGDDDDDDDGNADAIVGTKSKYCPEIAFPHFDLIVHLPLEIQIQFD